MVVSVSEDGQYAISTDSKNFAILWNLKEKTKKIISRNANMFSAYFVKNTPFYLWQDLNNIVHVNNIFNVEIKKMNHFKTFGHVITSDLKTYISSDIHWNLYVGFDHFAQKILNACDSGGFLGAGKLLNLILSSDNKTLLSVGSDGSDAPLEAGMCAWDANIPMVVNHSLLRGPVLWDIQSKKPIRKFNGNGYKTIAILSPNDKKVISGCEQSFGFVWNTETGEKELELDDLQFGQYLGDTCKNLPLGHPNRWDKTNLITMPEDFYDEDSPKQNAILALKYIDLKGHYLRFNVYGHYAILYSDQNPKPLQYFSLRKEPKPINQWFDRNQAIDTAPKANILVMAKQNGKGIIVYKFDPKTLELKRIWVS